MHSSPWSPQNPAAALPETEAGEDRQGLFIFREVAVGHTLKAAALKLRLVGSAWWGGSRKVPKVQGQRQSSNEGHRRWDLRRGASARKVEQHQGTEPKHEAISTNDFKVHELSFGSFLRTLKIYLQNFLKHVEGRAAATAHDIWTQKLLEDFSGLIPQGSGKVSSSRLTTHLGCTCSQSSCI